MKKVYFLKTCDTCRRILKEVNLNNFEIQEVKSSPITTSQLEEMHVLSKSYESLFNKRAKKYKILDLKNKSISEEEYKNLIVDEYTFLKRPIFIVDNDIFIGNSKKEIERLKEKIS